MEKVLREALKGVPPEAAKVLLKAVGARADQPRTGEEIATLLRDIINSRAKTIDQFCAAWGLSRAFYYKLRSLGKGPAEMRLGGTVRISNEAEQAWAKARERESVAAAREVARRKAAKACKAAA